MRRFLIFLIAALAAIVFVSSAIGQGQVYLPHVENGTPAPFSTVVPTPKVVPSATSLPTPTPIQLDVFGRSTIHAWPEFVARTQVGISATASIALIGDSWTSRDLISGPLRYMLQQNYGNGGVGYIGIGVNHGAPKVPGVRYARSGTWVDRDKKPDAYGLDLASATTMDLATPATVTIDAPTTDFVVHYLTKPGGGSFSVHVDNGPVQVVQAGATISNYATLRVGPFADAPHRLTITLADAGSTGVTLFGVDAQRNTGGVRVHRIGSGGATALLYASQDRRFTTGSLAALNPDVVLILLGTNDMRFNTRPTAYHDNLVSIVRWVRAEAPDTDVILATPADNSMTDRHYSMSTYAATMRQALSRSRRATSMSMPI